MKSYLACGILLLVCLSVVNCSRQYILEDTDQDLDSAATGHHGHGRVQIKVYRGPNEGHEHFAPHGYWVKQPADDH